MRNLNYFFVLLTLIMIVVFGGLFLLNGKSYKGKNGGEEKEKVSEGSTEEDDETEGSELMTTTSEEKPDLTDNEQHEEKDAEPYLYPEEEATVTEPDEPQKGPSEMVHEESTADTSIGVDEGSVEEETKQIVYNSETIMMALDQAVISDSGTYTAYFNKNPYEYKSIGAYGKTRTDCFSVNTGASFNMWGGGTQFVIFNVEDLNENKYLSFTICGENGTEGEMNVSVYLNRELEGEPDYNYHFESCTVPQTATIDIQGASSLGILVNNLSSRENRMVFYDLAVSGD